MSRKKMTPNNWRDSFKSAFKSSHELSLFLDTSLNSLVDEKYPVFIPKRIAEKIKSFGVNSPYAKQYLTNPLEINPSVQNEGLEDPIGDKIFHKAPQLIHRYKSRVLFTPTTICPVHCRYCFRKNELYDQEEIFQADFEKTLDYLNSHPEINEIIFTGGDPLTLSNEKIDFFLNSFSKINHLKFVRFHTRYPVILPERFDSYLLTILKKYVSEFHQISVVVHANLAEELDHEAAQAIAALNEINITLLSQSVLLRGVNDNIEALTHLVNKLIEQKIRPYYLHHPDFVKGGMHFCIEESEGKKLYYELRQRFPGWAVPQYIKETPEGAGKSLISNN